MQNPEAEEKVTSVADDYDGLWREPRKAGAKGVVGRISWADVFDSTDLLEEYWQELIRSYAAASLTNVSSGGQMDHESAQLFVDHLQGTREVHRREAQAFSSN
jgi:hypothetical protein